jgi:hypothetical protein
MAIGLILELQDAGYNIPDDVAVMGFDDIPEASIIRPHLTTVAQTPVEIGRKLVTALFDRIEGANDPNGAGMPMYPVPGSRPRSHLSTNPDCPHNQRYPFVLRVLRQKVKNQHAMWLTSQNIHLRIRLTEYDFCC